MFEKLKTELGPDLPRFRTLCPTRWIVRAATMESVIKNYVIFQQLLYVVKLEMLPLMQKFMEGLLGFTFK